MVAATVIKKIGDLRSHNTFGKFSRKECENNSADKPVHDEGVYAFASHQESTFLVQSHIGQEEGRTTKVTSTALKTVDTL